MTMRNIIQNQDDHANNFIVVVLSMGIVLVLLVSVFAGPFPTRVI